MSAIIPRIVSVGKFFAAIIYASCHWEPLSLSPHSYYAIVDFKLEFAIESITSAGKFKIEILLVI